MDTPARYRIDAVAQLTGISSPTLRVWERRYGFPRPQRSASAYRIYGARDVDLLLKMRDMVAGGMPPAEAARQLLEAELVRDQEALQSDPHATIAARLVSLAGQMNLAGFQRELQRALVFDSGLVVSEKILRPALVAIGDRWHGGELSVASEHLASQLIGAALLDLMRTSAPSSDSPMALMACFAEEQHTLPLYGAALRFASAGYRTLILGARTPPSAIARGVEAFRPALVALSVSVLPEPASLARELVDAYADACSSTPWFVGGAASLALSALVTGRGGMILPDDAEETRRTLHSSMARRPRPSP